MKRVELYARVRRVVLVDRISRRAAAREFGLARKTVSKMLTYSACRHNVDSLPLSVREWRCPGCGVVHDRDVNAAVNLKNMAVSSTISACGEVGSGLRRKTKTKPASVKQIVSVVPV